MQWSFGPKGKFSKCTKFPMIFHGNKSLRRRNYKKSADKEAKFWWMHENPNHVTPADSHELVASTTQHL